MVRFLPTRRDRPCPVCENTSGDCRTTPEDLILCLKRPDGDVPGFRYLGRDKKQQLWGLYQVDGGNDAETRRRDREQYRRQRQQRKRFERQRHDCGLSAAERDRQYRRLLSQLILKPHHRQALRDRGLSDRQIDAGEYRSVTPGQRIEGVSGKLPGMAGDRVAVATTGILIPARDARGRIVGIQVRLDTTESGKYRWLSSQEHPVNLPGTGELPLSIARGPSAKEVWHVEGIGKPQFARDRHGITCIGASGGNFTASEEMLRATLGELQPDRVIFAPDAGALANRQVAARDRKTVATLRAMSCEVAVADWGQGHDKTAGDLDEIDSLDRVRYVTPELWFGPSDLSTPVALRVSERYLSTPLPSREPLIAIRSVQGTGKTEAIASHIAPLLRQGRPVLVLTHRESLGRALAERFGVSYRTERDDLGRVLGFALCVDSLRDKWSGFRAEDWAGTAPVVVVDEVEQVVQHLLAGGTDVKRYRVEVLRELQKLLAIALTEGQVIAADADLSDFSIDFLVKMSGCLDVQPWVLLNDWRPEGWSVTWYEDNSPERWECNLEAAIAEGKRPLIQTASQQPRSKYGTRALEQRLRKRFPERRIVRIDSESLADPSSPAYGCMVDLDRVLSEYDIAICSPSIETGVSIDLRGHFDSVWAYGAGNIALRNFRQFLWRLRDPVPRHVWVAPHGPSFSRIGNGATDSRRLLDSQQRQTRANLAALREFDLDPAAIEGPVDPVAMRTWAHMGARHNAGLAHYRSNLAELLREQGHRLRSPDDDFTDSERNVVREQMTAARDEVWDAQCAAIAAASELADVAVEKLSEARTKTPEQQHQLRKHRLAERYGIEVTPDLVKRDDGGWHAQLQLAYYLTRPEQLRTRDRDRAESFRKSGGAFVPDLNQGLLSAKVGALVATGVAALTARPDVELTASNPTVRAIAEAADRHRGVLRDCCGLKIHRRKNGELPAISIVKQLLAPLGLDLIRSRRSQRDGARVQYYRLSGHDDGRIAIFEAWDEQAEKCITVIPKVARQANKSDCAAVPTVGEAARIWHGNGWWEGVVKAVGETITILLEVGDALLDVPHECVSPIPGAT